MPIRVDSRFAGSPSQGVVWTRRRIASLVLLGVVVALVIVVVVLTLTRGG